MSLLPDDLGQGVPADIEDSIVLARSTLHELRDEAGNDPVVAAKRKLGVRHRSLV